MSEKIDEIGCLCDEYGSDLCHEHRAAPKASLLDRMAEALQNSMARINDLEIIINEARELGLTLFICGDVWPKHKTQIDSVLAEYDKYKEGR